MFDTYTMVLLMLVLCFVLKVFADPPGGYYHAKYDYLDLDDVLNHKRLLYHYANCLLSREVCPPQGMELKEILPEALETTCLRCTEKQRHAVLHTIRRLKLEYPDIWREVSDLWDPTGDYYRKFETTFGSEVVDHLSPNDITSNFLGNRFAEDDAANELTGNVKSTTTTTTPKPTKPKLKPRPIKFSTLTTKPTPATVQNKPLLDMFTMKPTLTHTTETSQPPTSTSATAAPALSPYWWVNNYGGVHIMTWRPSNSIFRPRPSWLSDVSTKVIQAGTQVAGMVLQTVQAALNGR